MTSALVPAPRLRMRFLMALLLGAMTGSACNGDMGRMMVEGSIKGQDGRAVAGALVALQYGSRARFESADASGSFRVSILDEPLGRAPVRMTVSARGYAGVETQLPESAAYRCEVALSEKTAASPPPPLRWDRICVKSDMNMRTPDTSR